MTDRDPMISWFPLDGTADAQLVGQLLELISELSRQTVALSVEIGTDLGVHPTDANALHLMAAAETPLSASQLGSALGLSSAATTGLLDRLTRAGLADRRGHPTDRRKVVVVPTDSAMETSLARLGPLFERVARAIDDTDDAGLRTVAEFLRVVVGRAG